MITYPYSSQLYNGKIYLIEDGQKPIKIYDIESNAWTFGAAPPSSVWRWTSQLYNGKIYCPADGGTPGTGDAHIRYCH